jgi:hypothetical protein
MTQWPPTPFDLECQAERWIDAAAENSSEEDRAAPVPGDTERAQLIDIARDAEQLGRWEEAVQIYQDMAQRFPRPIAIGDARESPWHRSGINPVEVPEGTDPDDLWMYEEKPWTGNVINVDAGGARLSSLAQIGTRVTPDDVDRVLCYAEVGEHHGAAAGIARLRDGRFVAWESNLDPTGTGFRADCYGGNADFAIAVTAGLALSYLSEQAREYLRWA